MVVPTLRCATESAIAAANTPEPLRFEIVDALKAANLGMGQIRKPVFVKRFLLDRVGGKAQKEHLARDKPVSMSCPMYGALCMVPWTWRPANDALYILHAMP